MTAHQGSIDSTDTDADSALYDQFSIFVGQNLEYYRAHFLAQQEATGFAFRPNPAAFVLGPIWAAFRRVWRLFWLAVLTDSLGVLLIAMGMVGEELDARDKFLLIVVGLIWLVAGRALIGASANWFLFRQFERWRIDQDCLPGTSRLAVLIGIAWVSLIYPLIAYRMLGHGYIGALDSFPDSRALTHGTASAIDDGVDWMIVAFGTFFEGITIVVRTMLELLESLLIGAPWPIVFALVCALAWRCASFHVMIFTLLSLIYLGLFGYWEKSLSTMALVGTSVVICAVFGLPLGIWSARSSRVNAVLRPILDIMQTLPPFVYLISSRGVFLNRKASWRIVHGDICHAAGCQIDDPGHPERSCACSRGRSRFWRLAPPAAVQGRASACGALDNGRPEPDCHDESFDGRGGGAHRRRRDLVMTL